MLTSRATKSDAVYQLKITLRDMRPPIWRRLLVPADITLGELHRIIQIAMDWSDSHLHQFIIDGNYFGVPHPDYGDEMDDESRVRLKQIAPAEKAKFRYEYDFGDSWEHDVVVEKILPADPTLQYPVCITGKRACLPEDSGGVWGYMGLLETLADPSSEDYEEMMEWVVGEIDTEAFDIEAVNKQLQGRQRSRKAA